MEMTVYEMADFLMDFSASLTDATRKVIIYDLDKGGAVEEYSDYRCFEDVQTGEYADRECYSFDVERDPDNEWGFIVTLNI